MKKGWLNYLIVVGILMILSACSDSEGAKADESEFPSQLAVSAYDVGSAGYAEVSAISNAITSEYGTQFRLLPSGNGVSRMMVIRDQTALFGRLGDEYQFALRGDEEFSDRSWGPQDVTVVWQSMTNMGGAVLENSSINKPEDLKGKKVPYLTAGASINFKTEAILAAGNLGWDDVEKVELTSYAAQAEALEQQRIDMATMLPDASALVEIAEMKGIRWVELSDDVNDESWERIQNVVPWAVPGEWSIGAGLSKDNPTTFLSYPYPFIAHKDVDEDIVYEFVHRLNETYDGYKDATPAGFLLGIEHINPEPLGAPMHEGTIRYLKEHNKWNDESQQKNDELIEFSEGLKKLWEETLKKAEEEGIAEKDFSEFWQSEKSNHLE